MRLTVGSCAPTPVLIEGFDASLPADAVVAAVLGAISPISDVRATREYRLHMVESYVRRLLDEVRS
jgi:CO/xanthine dehydrogenase FAD-binding subunit